jgi:hypothetical protein
MSECSHGGSAPPPRRQSSALAERGILWGLVVSLLIGLVSGCSINRRSDALACQTSAECEAGRTCLDHFCVVAGSSGDAGVCPPECSRCLNGTCFFDCTLQRCSRLTCPLGWKCDILCGPNNCNRIDCTDSQCNITCLGESACTNIDCGALPCSITCTGRRACDNVDCSDSCACGVLCTTLESCTNDVTCPTGCDSGNGCQAQTPACNTCP